jgi:hypothetical protein
MTLESISHAVEDAVYLDEDSYNEVAPVSQYMRTIQVPADRKVALGWKVERDTRLGPVACRRSDCLAAAAIKLWC